MVIRGSITIEVLGVSVADRHGDRADTVAGSIAGCAFAPSSGQSAPSSRETVEFQADTTVLLYVPPTDVPVKATSKIRLPDQSVWEVDGDPQWWKHPVTGWDAGGVIRIRRAR
jgi:hypothetical protein